MTLANKITLLRIILIPVIIIGLLQNAPLWAILVYTLTVVTDILDGAAARWLKQKTVLGGFLDPLADKLLLVSVYLALAHTGLVPMWVFVVVFSRDLLILLGWSIIYVLTQKFDITPRWAGKLSTFLQMITVLVILLPPLEILRSASLWAMVAFTAASTVDYVWVGGKKLSQLG